MQQATPYSSIQTQQALDVLPRVDAYSFHQSPGAPASRPCTCITRLRGGTSAAKVTPIAGAAAPKAPGPNASTAATCATDSAPVAIAARSVA